MKNKFNIFLHFAIVCIFVKICVSTETITQWTPNSLHQEYITRGIEEQIVDPENFINSNKLLVQMKDLIHDIKVKKNIDIYLFVFSNIYDSDSHSVSPNIETFTNELSYLVLQGDFERNKNSIFITFAIGNRKSRIRTGSNIIELLSDSDCNSYLDSIKHLLSVNKYGEALTELLTSINDKLIGIYSASILFYIGKYIIILGLLIFISAYFNKKKLDNTVENKLNKLKKICSNKRPRKEIIESVCVICLEELKQSAETNQNDSNCINKEETHSDNGQFIAKLECGHSFHSNCLSSWMLKQNKCPICRENIDKQEDNIDSFKETNFAQHIVNIQTILHPDLEHMNFDYSNDNISWYYINSSDESTSGNWDDSTGGATSNW